MGFRKLAEVEKSVRMGERFRDYKPVDCHEAYMIASELVDSLGINSGYALSFNEVASHLRSKGFNEVGSSDSDRCSFVKGGISCEVYEKQYLVNEKGNFSEPFASMIVRASAYHGRFDFDGKRSN